jgi:Protein of unknown function (DUF3429)
MRPRRDDQLHTTAWLVSVAGLVPFFLIFASLLFARHDHPLHRMLVDFLRFYCAIILSFLGGVRFGLIFMKADVPRLEPVLAAVPVLVAVIAGFLPPLPSIAILLFAFCALGAWDSLTLYQRPELSGLVRIRIVMTLLTAAALLCLLFLI